MKVKVLIPTHDKTKEEIIDLFYNLQIESDAVFLNQNDSQGTETINLNGCQIQIVSSKSRGVSVNRNDLIKYADGDLNIFIDDDCALVNNYEDIIIDFFKNNECDCAIFNGVWATHQNKLVHNKKTKLVKHFFDISYAGGPGFVFKKNLLTNLNLSFSTKLGYPNYICAGEDSFFYYNLAKSKARTFRVSIPIFKVIMDEDNSCYYQGINQQYLETRGFVLKLIYPKLYPIFFLKHAIRFKKRDKKLKFKFILKHLIHGSRIRI